jgi:plastocyanin
MTRIRLLPPIVLAVLLGACSVSEGGGAGGAGAEPAGSPAPNAASAIDGATGTAAAGRRIDPRRGGLDLGFGEWAITLEADRVRPGPITFVIRNGGTMIHGFEIQAEDDDGDHSGPGHGELKLEGPAFGPGETVRIDAVLPPGRYEIECFVAEHDDRGMRATLIVERGAPLVAAEPAGAEAGAGVVAIADFAFSPPVIEVEAGGEVSWTNDDPTPHTVTAEGAFDSGTLDPGARFSASLDRPGSYAYVCQIHPTMRGTVRVVDPAAP